MRRPVAFGLIAGLTLFLSFSPPSRAGEPSPDMRWEVLGPSERVIIDRLAAEFYEQSLRYAQSSAIEAHTSELYAGAAPAERARFREGRRENWRNMNEAQRSALRAVKRPSFRNLTEEQKAPFRRHALDQLGAAGAIDGDALAAALRKDV